MMEIIVLHAMLITQIILQNIMSSINLIFLFLILNGLQMKNFTSLKVQKSKYVTIKGMALEIGMILLILQAPTKPDKKLKNTIKMYFQELEITYLYFAYDLEHSHPHQKRQSWQNYQLQIESRKKTRSTFIQTNYSGLNCLRY